MFLEALTLGNVTHASNLDDAIKMIEDIAKERSKCRVDLITIYMHGNPGQMITTGNQEGSVITTQSMRIIEEGRLITDDTIAISGQLQRLKKLLCKDGRIIFNACNAGKHGQGALLEDQLARYFGFPVDLPNAEAAPAWGGTIYRDSSTRKPTNRDGVPLSR